MQNTIRYKAFILLAAVIVFSGGCRKAFNLPTETSYLSTQANYTQLEYPPILGQTNIFKNVFQPINSTFPINFEVKNPHFGDGRDASDMLAKKPTLVWTQEYTGKEASLAAILAKRKFEDHSILEIRGNGDILWWYTGASPQHGGTIRPQDTITYPQNIRYFDVKMTNSGGTRTISNLSIKPQVERPYTPYDDYNIITGKPETTTPSGNILVHNYATLDGIVGDGTNQLMQDTKNAATGIVYVYIRRFSNDTTVNTGHKLRFVFLDKDSTAINPLKFKDTKWLDQVHGFKADGTPGCDFTNTYAEYNVAYPIPLVNLPTKFTSGGVANLTGGSTAHVEFSYSRTSLAFGGRQTGRIIQDFQIWQPGDWEIVFHFKTVNPKFDND